MKDRSKGFLSEFEGTAPVFKFTLIQFFKNKATIVSMIIIFAMCFLSIPLSLISTGTELPTDDVYENIGTLPENIYIVNTTGVHLSYTNKVIADSPFSQCNFFITTNGENDFTPGDNDVVIKLAINPQSYSFEITGYYTTTTVIDDNTASALLYTVKNAFEFSKYQALRLDEDTVSSILYSGYFGNVESLDSFNSQSGADSESRVIIQLLFSIVVLMLSTLSASYVIRAVVEEKSSKLVEFLLVNVKPLALLAGKILAVMISVFAIIGVMIIGSLASNYFSSEVLGLGSFTDTLGVIGFSFDSLNIGWELIVVVIISVVLSYITFSIISGIAGACCNSMDEMSSASLIAILPALIGYIATPVISAIENPVMDVIASLLPIIGSFYAPSAYLLGSISLGVMIISIAVQLAVAIILALFCRRVYSYIIMYKGNKLSAKALFSIAGKGDDK